MRANPAKRMQHGQNHPAVRVKLSGALARR
jgi:hypothetical protein